MRNNLLLLPLLIVASPAMAQQQPVQLPPEISDPATADRLADAVQAVSNIVLDLQVGGLQAALDGREPTAAEKRLTIRDLGRRGNPDFDRDIDQRIADVKPVIRQSQRAINDSLPALIQSIEQARESLERIAANLPDPTYPRR